MHTLLLAAAILLGGLIALVLAFVLIGLVHCVFDRFYDWAMHSPLPGKDGDL